MLHSISLTKAAHTAVKTQKEIEAKYFRTAPWNKPRPAYWRMRDMWPRQSLLSPRPTASQLPDIWVRPFYGSQPPVHLSESSAKISQSLIRWSPLPIGLWAMIEKCLPVQATEFGVVAMMLSTYMLDEQGTAKLPLPLHCLIYQAQTRLPGTGNPDLKQKDPCRVVGRKFY